MSKEAFSPVTKLFEVEAPEIARKGKAGQFLILRIDERGERIPLTIADSDASRGTVTLVVQEVGKTTRQLGTLGVGDTILNVMGPLGHATPIERYGTVVCVGGGVGIAPVYPIAKALRAAGNRVLSVIGARSRDLLFWEDRMRAVSDELVVCTDDGSAGRKALVTEPLKSLLERERAARTPVAKVWAIGPAVMMKFCTAAMEGFPETGILVSLNTVMVDGTGMCGGCRVSLKRGAEFVCVDGPEFDGRDVDWELLLSRQAYYKAEEKEALDEWQAAAAGSACSDEDCQALRALAEAPAGAPAPEKP